jgi:hypothetical protein
MAESPKTPDQVREEERTAERTAFLAVCKRVGMTLETVAAIRPYVNALLDAWRKEVTG